MILPLTGLVAAAYTPMHADGTLNLSVLDRMADHFIDNDVRGVFIAGTTGECHSLTVDERRDLTSAWCNVAGDRLTLIVHVGSNCLDDALALASHAENAGAHGISAMAPFFFKPTSPEHWVSYCQTIAEAASDCPFYLYHIPPMTGVDYRADQFLALASDRIANLAGVKFSCGDLAQLQACLAVDDGRFDVLFGQDENLLAALALGVRGAIGSTYNYAAPLYHRIMEAFAGGDHQLAAREQLKSVQLVKQLSQFGVMQAGKAIMQLQGVPCGPVRQPLLALTDQQIGQLASEVGQMEALAESLT